MKNKIWIFLLSCLMVLGLCTAFVGCDLSEDVPHEVKYVVDGEVVYTQKVYSATEIAIPQDPSRVDYDFAGWFYDEDTWQKKFIPGDLKGGYLTYDITVYAKWVPHNHKVDNGVLSKIDGKYFFAGKCAGCDTVFDSYVNVKETVIVRATCLNEGVSKYSYTLLGVEYSITEVTPKGNHAINGVDISTLVDENGYVPYDIDGVYIDNKNIACGETSSGTFICSDCNCYLEVTVVKSHQYNNWTMVQVGSGANEYYTLSSTCARSDCDENTSYVAEIKYLTEDITSEASCVKTGSKTVVYNNGKITVSCDAFIPKTAHIYNGKPIDSYATTNGAYNYYDENGEVVFDNLFADHAAPACGEKVRSYFNCECEECVQLVFIEVYKNHNFGDAVVITPAGCTTTGLNRYSCKDCNYFEEDVTEAVDHSYSYKLTRLDDGDDDYTNDVFSFVGCCIRCDATTEATTVPYTSVHHEVVLPTCTNPGKHTYSYGMGDNYASLEIKIPTNDEHILNGVIAKYVYAGKDGVVGDGYSYKYSINGIQLTANSDYQCSVHSGKLYNGFYRCESCGDLVYVQVYVDHLGDRTTVKEPNCGVAGEAEVDCQFCGNDQKTPISATGLHEFEYSIDFSPEDVDLPVINYYLVSTCKICGYEANRVEIESSDIKIEVKTFVSCLEDGVLSYTYTKGDITAYGERVYAKKGEHTLDNKLVSEHIKTYTVNGTEYECVESTVPGVILPADKNFSVGDIVSGVFICECCGNSVRVQVIIVEK